MSDDKRLHVKAVISNKLDRVADYIGVTPTALVAVMLDEYVRARPDIASMLNSVKPTSVAPKRETTSTSSIVPDSVAQRVLADWGEED